MRAARDWGDPPLVHLGIKSRTSKPVLTVKLALRMYEDSLCSCGHSAFLAHGNEGVGEYEADTLTCHACKELETEKTDGPGKKVFVRDIHDEPPDEDPPEEEGEG